jgi:hypothetical protein
MTIGDWQTPEQSTKKQELMMQQQSRFYKNPPLTGSTELGYQMIIFLGQVLFRNGNLDYAFEAGVLIRRQF